MTLCARSSIGQSVWLRTRRFGVRVLTGANTFVPRVILASKSEQRKKLFSCLNVPFEVIAADIDERAIRDPDPGRQAERIARAKAEAVAAKEPGIIIAADTFCVLGREALEKPRDRQDAIRMLTALSAHTATCYTGFCYLDRERGIDESAATATPFTFRTLDTEEIAAYVDAFPVATWSAAFSPSYPYGMTLVAKINGSFTGFTHGLPMELLIPLLARSGIAVKPWPDTT